MHTDIKDLFLFKKPLPKALNRHVQLARLDRPIGIFLLFLPALWGIILSSQGSISFFWISIFFLGSLAMRGAGCIINDLTDIHFDKQVERTANRPLASQALSIKQALFSLSLHIGAAFICFLLLPLAAQKLCVFYMIGVVVYPWMKRITYWPQLFLGLVFNGGILIASATLRDTVTFESLLLYLSAIIWTLFYDTIYAHQDIQDDLKIGVKSSAIKLQHHTKSFLIACILAQLTLLTLIGILQSLHALYFIGIISTALYLTYQTYTLVLSLPKACLKIFKAQLWVGLAFAACLYLGKFL